MSTPAPASESSSVRTAYAFLRPLPAVRDDDASPGEARQVAPRDRWDRLFPSTAGIPDAGSSLDVAGLQLGQFLIQERIGRGGMGAVFRAVDLRLDRVVALKVLAPEYTRDPASVQRFQNEARAAAKLDHENIAQVFASGEDGGQQYIAFEFVTGTNIRDMIQQRRMLTPTETVNYLLQMADALRHTSSAGVVHRDIKPSNIIITPAGRAKLVDLGLARHQTQNDLTVHGTTLGTFDYISPEQALDPRNVDVRSDLYSLGCTAYHMLTGEPPYNRGSMFQKVLDHHQNEAPDPRVKNPHVPPALSLIVRKMMASQIEDRYQRPDDLIRDLLPWAAALGVPAQGGLWNELPSPRFSWAEHRGWIVAVCVLTILGVIASIPPREAEPLPSAAVTAIQPVAESSNADRSSNPDASSGASGGGSSADTTPSESKSAGNQVSSGISAGFHQWLSDKTLLEQLGELPLTASKTPPARETDSARVTPRAPLPPPADTENRFWVSGSATDPGGGVAKPYATLEAACLEAPDNATIELRFDDESPAQRPVRIEGKSLRMKAQMGKRPVLRFEAPGPVGQPVPSSMLTVTNGALELYGTDIVFRVPRGQVVDRWAVFTLEQAKRFTLRGVSVTLENGTRQQPATIIELKQASRTLADRMMPDEAMRGATSISITESIFRGEADGFRLTEPIEVKAELSHTAWGLGGNLLAIDTRNSVQMATSIEPPPCQLRLDHITAVVDSSLVSVDAGEAGVAPTVDVRCDSSILSVLRKDRPLISMQGPIEMEEWLDRLVWAGTANYIDAVGPWWSIASLRSISTPERKFNASDWSQHWNSTGNTSIDRNVFENTDLWEKAVFHEIDLKMFYLFPTNEFYRAPEAANGGDAGIDWGFPALPKKFPKL